VAWVRWFKRAVLKSARQVWGAERWIKSQAGPLFLDSQCSVLLPIDLPSGPDVKIHRVVVANGIQSFDPYSAGLRIIPSIEGDDHLRMQSEGGQLFAVGRLSNSRGFVHVLDDTSLVSILTTLDTVSDFTSYLEEREKLFADNNFLGAHSERDLLAI
jgi:hypothetical protein